MTKHEAFFRSMPYVTAVRQNGNDYSVIQRHGGQNYRLMRLTLDGDTITAWEDLKYTFGGVQYTPEQLAAHSSQHEPVLFDSYVAFVGFDAAFG